MIKNVLFDLDGTLLRVDMAGFKDRYFELLRGSAIVKRLGDGGMDKFLGAFRAIHHGDGSVSNREALLRELERQSGLERQSFQRELDEFFNVDFDGMRVTVRGRSRHLTEAVDELKKKGYRLILATGPVFPESAILRRLDWAGFCKSDFDYITSYENSGYYKYDARYYLDLTKKLSLDPGQCLMVGNSVREDLAAMEAGMECYFLKGHGVGDFREGMCLSGTPEGFLKFVRELPDIK